MAGIEIKDNEYNLTKVFIDSDIKDDDNTLGTPIVLNQLLYWKFPLIYLKQTQILIISIAHA